jgi:hypothetical protein
VVGAACCALPAVIVQSPEARSPKPGVRGKQIYCPDMSESQDAPLAGTYVGVLVLEATIILLLWILGRAFA